MKMKLAILAMLFCPSLAAAQFVPWGNGWCQLGAQNVITQGVTSSGTQPISGGTKTIKSGVMASYPQCQVTVYLTGTITEASLFSGPTGGALSNPFTANTDGSILFYATPACYDIVTSSGVAAGSQMPVVHTYPDICIGPGGGTGGGSVLSVTAAVGGGVQITGTPTINPIVGLITTCLASQVLQWSGSSWVCSSIGAGTVTSVGIGPPTGFGAGSAVTTTGSLTFSMPTGWAAGSLLVGTGPNTVANLGIGANGTCLGVSTGTPVWIGCGGVSGSGASPLIPLWTGTSTLGNSVIAQGTVPPGNPNFGTIVSIGGGFGSNALNSTGALTLGNVTSSACLGGGVGLFPDYTSLFPCASLSIAKNSSSTNASSDAVGLVSITSGQDGLLVGASIAAVGNNSTNLDIRGAEISAVPSSGGFGNLRGLVVYVGNAGAGGTLQQGIYIKTTGPNAGGTITNQYGIYVESPTMGAGGILSHNYGLYLADQTTAGGGTNSDPWGIFEAGTAKNQLGGELFLPAGTTVFASLNIASGVSMTSPTSGSLWNQSGILSFYDGAHTNSLTTIQAATTSGHCAQWSGTAGLLVDSGAACGGGGGGGVNIQVNAGSNLVSPVNFQNGTGGNVVDGVTINFSNPTGSNVQAAYSGILTPAGGGLGTSTAPTIAQIPIGQSGNVYAPETVSGDCTISSTGSVVCPKSNGNAVPTGVVANQILMGTSASTFSFESLVNCLGSSNALNYNTSTFAFSCNTIATLSNPMTGVGDMIDGTTGGSVARVAAPTSGNSPYILTSTPSGGSPTAVAWGVAGVPVDTQSGATFTIQSDAQTTPDRAKVVNLTNITTSTAVTVPQAGSAGMLSNYPFLLMNSGSVVATATPTTSTVNGNATLKLVGAVAGHNPEAAFWWSDAVGTTGNWWAAEILPTDANGRLGCEGFMALTGDVTSTAGACATVVGKVNGVTYGTSPSTNTVPVITGTNAVTYEAVPNAALANSSITINTTSPITGGASTALGSSVTLACATCLVSGGALGTPSSATLTNATGYPFSSLAAPTGTTTISMGANPTVLNYTQSVAWNMLNTTLATTLTTNQSPGIIIGSQFWSGTGSAPDNWLMVSQLAAGTNAASTLLFSHSGSTGTAIVSIPQALTAGTDASVAGTVQLSNGTGGGAHTIFGSAATTTNTLLGPATVPATGDLISCTTSSTTCTLTDSGFLATNVVRKDTTNVGTSSMTLDMSAITTAGGLLITNTSFKASTGTGTVGHLACYTSSGTVGNCAGTPSNNFIGVFTTGSAWTASGETAVVLDGTVSVTFGDILCASTTSAGTAHDNGATSCANGQWVGIVKATAASVTSATAFVNMQGGTPFAVNGAASASAVNITGTVFTGGTATTTFPLVYFNQGASGPTSFSTAGTELGMNAVSGFAGNFLDFHVNGGASVAGLTAGGLWTGTFAAGSTAHGVLVSEGTAAAAVATGAGTAGQVLVSGGASADPSFVAATSLATVNVTVDTGTPVTVSGTTLSTYHFNENATAGTAVTYNLPTATAGIQKCFTNANNGSAANTGVITIATSASGQFIIFTDGTLSATGGNVTSGGAAADSACVVGVDSTHWMLSVTRGTWTKH